MTDHQHDDDQRTLELSVEVEGTPEEVWRAIATGPGISSWYVPHQVEEREGGHANASFGPGPEMQIPGRVTAWEPPHRVKFEGGDDSSTLAFEWLVEARDGGSCVVRLVNTGFGTGEEWDAQYDGMAEGWKLFLFNLQLHLQHFRGRDGRSVLPMGAWPGERDAVWTRLVEALGLPADAREGDHVATSGDAPRLAGTVVATGPNRLGLLLDEPARGTAFIAAEGHGDATGVSVWQYLYGDDREAIASEIEPAWWAFLAESH